jgi:hypothetical protein
MRVWTRSPHSSDKEKFSNEIGDFHNKKLLTHILLFLPFQFISASYLSSVMLFQTFLSRFKNMPFCNSVRKDDKFVSKKVWKHLLRLYSLTFFPLANLISFRASEPNFLWTSILIFPWRRLLRQKFSFLRHSCAMFLFKFRPSSRKVSMMTWKKRQPGVVLGKVSSVYKQWNSMNIYLRLFECFTKIFNQLT